MEKLQPIKFKQAWQQFQKLHPAEEKKVNPGNPCALFDALEQAMAGVRKAELVALAALEKERSEIQVCWPVLDEIKKMAQQEITIGPRNNLDKDIAEVVAQMGRLRSNLKLQAEQAHGYSSAIRRTF